MAALIQSSPAPQESRSDAQREIDHLADGGYTSSYGVPPNNWVIKVAKHVVGALTPDRIIPMADGGIGLVFPQRAGRAARVNITNDEGIVVTLCSRDDDPNYVEVEQNDIVSVVSAFLRN